MPLLAKIVSNVRQDAVARRDPVQQLTVTTQDVNVKLDFFEETLTMDVSRDYLRDLFYDLKHAIQMREITIDAVSSLNAEMTKIANNATDSLAVVTEELEIQKGKTVELQRKVRELMAEAAEAENTGYEQGRDYMIFTWAESIVEANEGITLDDATRELVHYLAQLQGDTNEDDAA